MRVIKILFVFLTLLGVCGCKVAKPALTNERIAFHKDHSENGLIIGSITFPTEKPKFNGYFFNVTNLNADVKMGRKNSTEIHISPEQLWKMKHDGQLDDGRTYLFVLERPVGDYEVSSVRLFTNSGIAALQRTDYSQGFAIPFEVKKGQITYVGNIKFNEYAVADEPVVTYSNNYRRDIDAIKLIKPTVDWEKAVDNQERTIRYK